LHTDDAGQKLIADQKYNFNFDHMAFTPAPDGAFNADHIKFLRLGFSGNLPVILQKVGGSEGLTASCAPLVETMRATFLRI
jgi:hypothetical protein